MRGISLRLKIVILLACTLGASLLSYLWVGSELVVRDKLSYIFDFNLAQIKTVGGLLESRLDRIRDVMHLTTGQQADAVYETLGIQAFVVWDSNGKVQSRWGKLEMDGRDTQVWIHELGWDPQWVRQQGFVVGAAVNGLLPIGVETQAGQAAIVFVRFQQKPESGASQQVELHLVDRLGHSTLLSLPQVQGISTAALQKLEQELAQASFPEGVREWSGHIVAYRRLKYQELTLVSYVSQDSAYAAVGKLRDRSIGLGLSIFFLALGLTLIVVKTITARLRQMWTVTQKVSEGDFKVRVPTRGIRIKSGDEVESLAHSFNAMASKIDDLMIQTAQKARMEKELETAQAVQSRFFPTQELVHPHLRVGGLYVPASECAGDWWNTAVIGTQVLMVIGDVTGHGVSSALVTASVHGAYSTWLKQKLIDASPVHLDVLMNVLNTAVRASAGGDTTMTFGAALLDTVTGQLQIVNASHFAPYIFSPGKAGDQILQGLGALELETVPALGRQDELAPKVGKIQLQPGDFVLWYTDGFFEGPAAVGKSVSNRKLIKLLLESARNNSGQMQKACLDAYQGLLALMDHASDRPDDITLLFAEVPKQAQFVSERQAA